MEWASQNFDVQALKYLDDAAKFMYSMILADLGQVRSYSGSNLLTNATATQNFLSRIP